MQLRLFNMSQMNRSIHKCFSNQVKLTGSGYKEQQVNSNINSKYHDEDITNYIPAKELLLNLESK
jgi:hypothetical protein